MVHRINHRNHPRKRLVGVTMNLESFGNARSTHSKQERPITQSEARNKLRQKARSEEESPAVRGQCCNGTCEVSWKPTLLTSSTELE